MILRLTDICKNYTQGKISVPALKSVTLSVDEGEYIAIMGPSGSGKTTLMNMIGCLDTATSGQYLLGDKNISKARDNDLADIRNREIGFVFHQFNLLPRLSALDNVALPLLYAGVKRGERRRRAAKMLERVGLSDRLSFKPNQLSGGQCQRVAIARAMVSKPKILLADEPTGALDSVSGKQIMELFGELNDEGMTIVMITHDALIAAHAKKIYYIFDGELRSGKPGQEKGDESAAERSAEPDDARDVSEGAPAGEENA